MKLSLNELLVKILEKLTIKKVTLTRTNNNYVDATSFGRLEMYRFGHIGLLRLNLGLSAQIPNNTANTEIGKMDATALVYSICIIAGQTNSAGHLLVQVDSNSIQIANYSGTTATGWYRGTTPVILL